MSEVENIKQRYEERKKDSYLQKKYSSSAFIENMVAEREKLYELRIREKLGEVSKIKVLEVGAGSGYNLHLFMKMGVPAQSIYANELLDDRVEQLRNNYPHIHIYPGNALGLPFENEFDVVFQSTVFTSILNNDFRKQLAQKMWRMTKPGGMILWYDFIFSNPSNPDVKKVSKKEVSLLFPHAKNIRFDSVTLAPPIARKVGSLYEFINWMFPFLRTHIVAVIPKDN